MSMSSTPPPSPSSSSNNENASSGSSSSSLPVSAHATLALDTAQDLTEAQRSIVRIPPLQQVEHHSERQPQQPTTQPHSNKTFCMATLFLCVLIASNQFVYFSNKCHPPICSSCRVVATTPTNTVNLYYYYYYYYYYLVRESQTKVSTTQHLPVERVGLLHSILLPLCHVCLSWGTAVGTVSHTWESVLPLSVWLCCGCVWLFVVR